MRKGQSATDAWILVGLITLAMVFFILFLPPTERARLLGDGAGGEMSNSSSSGEILLKKNIGSLEYFAQGGYEHPITAVSLFETKESKLITQINPFVVSKGWFTNKDYTHKFSIQDIGHLSNVLLSFDAAERKGILTISLNNKVIFEGKLETYSPSPIQLKDLQEENVLSFSVSTVGAAFWSVNRYQLSNMKIIGDYTDISRQRATNTFTISPTEKRNLLDATLSYVPDCNQRDVGSLTVTLNDAIVYSGVPDCNTINRATVTSSMVKEGLNSLAFRTSMGSYHIDQIIVKSNLKDVRTFIDYFELNEDNFKAVQSGSKKAFVEIDFVDDSKRKRAQLNINGHLTFVDQVAPFYARNLDPWMQPGGRNYIEVVPETALNIAELRVVLK